MSVDIRDMAGPRLERTLRHGPAPVLREGVWGAWVAPVPTGLTSREVLEPPSRSGGEVAGCARGVHGSRRLHAGGLLGRRPQRDRTGGTHRSRGIGRVDGHVLPPSAADRAGPVSHRMGFRQRHRGPRQWFDGARRRGRLIRRLAAGRRQGRATPFPTRTPQSVSWRGSVQVGLPDHATTRAAQERRCAGGRDHVARGESRRGTGGLFSVESPKAGQSPARSGAHLVSDSEESLEGGNEALREGL